MFDSLDISMAFLNGDINGDVYVCQPLGFVDPEHPNKVWKEAQQSPVWTQTEHAHMVLAVA